MTLETARLAKKLRYNGKYLYTYRDGVLTPNATFDFESSVDVEDLDLEEKKREVKIVYHDEFLPCPTQTALSRWVREKYKVYTHVDCNASGWYWEIEKTDGTIYPTKEEALKDIDTKSPHYIDTVKIEWEEWS